MILWVIVVYLAIVLSIGLFSHKLFRNTGEDYFLATRSIGPVVLFMSLFGTHMTAFTILGASAEAYQTGIGVFALMASSSALVVPCVFFFVGTRLWAIGKKHGYLTQIQYFRDRWESNTLGLVLFVLLNLLLIPYLLIGVMGGSLTLNQMTHGAIPEWAGGLLVIAVISLYVIFGGMRGTAWVNTFQTAVFMTCGALAFIVISRNLGGFEAAMIEVAERRPELLIRGENIRPLQLLSYTFIPLSAGMFPHLFNHWLTARRAETFRYTLYLYPVSIALVWLPSVLLGVLGVINFPDLQGPASNAVLPRMIELHAPGFLAGVLAAGVVSSVMNSLDSQSLAIGSMFTQDIVRHYGFRGQMTESQQVLYGRIFVFAILMLTYALSLFSNRSIFRLGVWSFTGFAGLFPIAVAGIYWKRATLHGVYSAIVSVAVLWIFFFIRSGSSEDYTVGGTGLMPVAVVLAVSCSALIFVSLVTRAPSRKTIEKFFPEERSEFSTKRVRVP